LSQTPTMLGLLGFLVSGLQEYFDDTLDCLGSLLDTP